MDTIDARKQFESWLDFIPEFLKEFFNLFPSDSRRQLNFSPESLDIVEDWILKRYPDTESMLPESESRTVNLLACYIGETIRKSVGGKWDIRLDDPKYAFHGVPIVIGAGNPKCPLTLATASADRRTGNYCRTVLENSKS